MSEGSSSEQIVGYYSYLFTFPSRPAMVLQVVAISIVGSTAAFLISSSMYWNLNSILHGTIGMALPLLLADFITFPLFHGDALLNPRRFTILTYASSIIYFLTIIISTAIGEAIQRPEYLFIGVLFAASVSALLRQLVLRVFSTSSVWRNIFTSFLQPVLVFSVNSFLFQIDVRCLAKGIAAFAILVSGVELFLWVMRRWDGGGSNIELIPLFRAFVLAWTEELSEPLEDQITQLGEEEDLLVDSIAFEAEMGGCKAAFIAPYIHPGPFRNVGSSGLPMDLSNHVGDEHGCEILVAHGISTHEKDLTRSGGNVKVAEAVSSNLLNSNTLPNASPMVWAEVHGARASCQLFGDVALVTLSLSPKSHDDLPDELLKKITEEAQGIDLKAIVVDSHHSIRLDGGLEKYDPENLYQAAKEALKLAQGMPKSTFAVGTARVVPDEWGLDEGMGPTGIAALVVRLASGQTSAYVVIDGNNMVSGLRDEIIEAVRSVGPDEAEVMTSDTHLVNAIGKTTKGYFPIGERTEWRRLIDHTVEAVNGAISKLDRAFAMHARTKVSGLMVLGSKGLETLSNVLESGFGLFKRAGLTIISASILLAIAVLYLL